MESKLNITNVINLGISEKEKLSAKCNHIRAVVDSTGLTHCEECGAVFSIFAGSAEEVKANIEQTIDILETIKGYLTIIPKETADEYFQIIPLLTRVPDLYNMALAISDANSEYIAYEEYGTAKKKRKPRAKKKVEENTPWSD